MPVAGYHAGRGIDLTAIMTPSDGIFQALRGHKVQDCDALREERRKSCWHGLLI